MLAHGNLDGETALLLASKHGFILAVNLLLAALGDGTPGVINKCDSRGASPLQLATAGSHEETVRALLAAGASVNLVDRFGCSALCVAAAAGSALAAVGAALSRESLDGASRL